MYKNKFASFFNFTQKERIGTLVLLVLILLFTCLPLLYPLFIKEKKYDQTAFEKEIATLKEKQTDNSKPNKYKQYEDNGYQNYYADKPDKINRQTKGVYFYFDPNTLDMDGWIKLGIREKTAASIQKYISKGGKFYKAEDINKIWGLSDDEKQKLLPFVRIDESRFIKKQEEKSFATSKYEKPVFVKTTIDINTADTSAFIDLPGIGSKLAQRIVNFRDKLGGFKSIDQLSETFGLADSTFQKIKPRLIIANLAVRQININTANTDELKAHPYIRYAIANAVVKYRDQHGNFKTIADLKRIMLVTDEIYIKLQPYVKVE